MKSKQLVEIIVSLFIDYEDQEVTFNCLDIITSLAKNLVLAEINLGKKLVKALLYSIRHTKLMTIYDECLECLWRLSLSTGNDEFLEDITQDDMVELIQALLSSNIETWEAALEILCNITDRKFETKIKIANLSNCIQRLVALIVSGSYTPGEERTSKLAALTLSNLNFVPKNKNLIMPYVPELALVAASDENTSPIIAKLLSDLVYFSVNS